jgi:hypothetical protein
VRQGLLLSAVGVAVAVVAGHCCMPDPAFAGQDPAFEQKSLQWMKQSRQVEEAIKAGKLSEAETILKSIISDRVNYNLDLSAERSSLARVYEAMGKNDQAEALLKINLKIREQEDGMQGYTLEFPLNQYADFLDKIGRKDESKAMRDRANQIELAANKEGERLSREEKLTQLAKKKAPTAEKKKQVHLTKKHKRTHNAQAEQRQQEQRN